ncbi:MAG: hypothetical protein ACJ73J_09250, partial [Actinomycetes bacterium]
MTFTDDHDLAYPPAGVAQDPLPLRATVQGYTAFRGGSMKRRFRVATAAVASFVIVAGIAVSATAGT